MCRTTKYKIIYLLLIALSLVAVLIFFLNFNKNTSVSLIIPIFLLVPGRIQGYFYREHFRGRKLLLQHEYKQALVAFTSFIEKLRVRKWLKHLIWLGGFIYTKDIEAMTLNNLGVCNLELDNLEEAKAYLESALKLDHRYATPYFNLAIISEMESNHQQAEEYLSTAVSLGYSGGTMDQVLIKAQEILAKVEG